MERLPSSVADAEQLLQLCDLLRDAAATVVDEWKKESFSDSQTNGTSKKVNGHVNGHVNGKVNGQVKSNILPSHKLHDAQRTILGISGALTEIVSEPHNRVQEVASQYWESRALYIAAERRIPDLIHDHGGDGMTAEELSAKTGIDALKLSRVMRCLCSIHIFSQPTPDRFTNNRISQALVHDEEFRANTIVFHLDPYTVSDHFPRYLMSEKGSSYSVTETPFQDAMGTDKARWEWLAERVEPSKVSNNGPGYPGVPDAKNWNLEPDEKGLVGRPELENFGLAMVAGGKVTAAATTFDYPWGDLGEGLVVDVGGGMGGSVFQLLKPWPQLKFVVQDRAEVIKQAKEEFWPKVAPQAVESGRVELQEHNFFKSNPVQGADVYWIRGVLHDWSDDYCVRILSGIKDSMKENSRILICDQVMNTTHGCDEIAPAPKPLPANYGYYTRYCHHRDLGLMCTINGIERTPSQFKNIIELAGLKLGKIYECRGIMGILEVRL